ncbi:MAG: rare lipoprotein A [Planctomycetota bacterium]|jgi:rare lipoprotein A
MRRWYLPVALMTLALLQACSFGVPIGNRDSSPVTPDSEIAETSSDMTKSRYGNPSSYVVWGKRYYVLDSADDFVQRGIASWYGTKFHGRKTSSGEVYNMYAMTAAHKRLPLPVYVHVHNLDNGRTLVVRVNDRGPFIEGRIIDLSYAAAKKLGVDGPGTANVEISVVQPGQSTPSQVVRAIPLTDQPERDVPLFIQMGSFSNVENADNLVQNLIDLDETQAKVSQLDTGGGIFYRVRLGPLFDIAEANAVIKRLKNKGFQSARIVVQDSPE